MATLDKPTHSHQRSQSFANGVPAPLGRGHTKSSKSIGGSGDVVNITATATSATVPAAPAPATDGARPSSAPAAAPARSRPVRHNVAGRGLISVAVRLRGLNDREVERHDYEAWEASNSEIALVEDDDHIRLKYPYDHVFGADATTTAVYSDVGKPVVEAVLEGFNSTIFAYGVTSSGKTHTMLGNEEHPGIVPLAIRTVFELIEKSPDKEFLLRLSMMEIYNEVLNDLLDNTRTNLKLREDKRGGIIVEGLKEEVVVSAEHALGVIADGDAKRKVSSTSYNEYSSRSHTIIRLSIESSDRAAGGGVTRTLAQLNLIDLAGSESAKVTYNKDRRLEGSFINKSLLTLGTVMSKLSDGQMGHIPYRDSKLTRLLAGSLTGNGAKIAVVCTITPASSQAEETHNTLKFANRCKRIEINAKRNEIMGDNSLILRYQEEIRRLKADLELYSQGLGSHDPLHPEMRNLRERLEEEKRALVKRDAEKTALETRITRLTRVILHSTKFANQDMQTRRRSLLSRTGSLLSNCGSEGGLPSPRTFMLHPAKSSLSLAGSSIDGDSTPRNIPALGMPQLGTPLATPRAYSIADLDQMSLASGYSGGQAPSTDVRWPTLESATLADVEHSVAAIRTAGDLFVGESLLQHCEALREEAAFNLTNASGEYDFLKEQNQVLANELSERNKAVEGLSDKVTKFEAAESSWAEKAVELQVLRAECQFIQRQLQDTAQTNGQLQDEIKRLALEKQAAVEAVTAAKELADARERAAAAAEAQAQAAQQLVDATELKYVAAERKAQELMGQVAVEQLASDASDAKAAMMDAKHASEALKRGRAEATVAELQERAAALEEKAATPMQVYVEVPGDKEEEEGGDAAHSATAAAGTQAREFGASTVEITEMGDEDEEEAALLRRALPAPERAEGEGVAIPSSSMPVLPAPGSVAQVLLEARAALEGLDVPKEAVPELLAQVQATEAALYAAKRQLRARAGLPEQDDNDQVAQGMDEDVLELRHQLQQWRDAAEAYEAQVAAMEQEAEQLRQQAVCESDDDRVRLLTSAVGRLEQANTRLQGDGLDGMSAEELGSLANTLNQAFDRVKVALQLRRMETVRAMRMPTPEASGPQQLPGGSLFPLGPGSQHDTPISTAAEAAAASMSALPAAAAASREVNEAQEEQEEEEEEIDEVHELLQEVVDEPALPREEMVPAATAEQAAAVAAVPESASAADGADANSAGSGAGFFDAGFSDGEDDELYEEENEPAAAAAAAVGMASGVQAGEALVEAEGGMLAYESDGQEAEVGALAIASDTTEAGLQLDGEQGEKLHHQQQGDWL